MQVLVVAGQNAAHRRHLGPVTSLAQFFRELGGAVGARSRPGGRVPSTALITYRQEPEWVMGRRPFRACGDISAATRAN